VAGAPETAEKGFYGLTHQRARPCCPDERVHECRAVHGSQSTEHQPRRRQPQWAGRGCCGCCLEHAPAWWQSSSSSVCVSGSGPGVAVAVVALSMHQPGGRAAAAVCVCQAGGSSRPGVAVEHAQRGRQVCQKVRTLIAAATTSFLHPVQVHQEATCSSLGSLCTDTQTRGEVGAAHIC
jgi:hypothetical protein